MSTEVVVSPNTPIGGVVHSRSIDVVVDVTEAAGLGEPLKTVATVTYPERGFGTTPAVVCFGFPGDGYNRNYFGFDMPGSRDGGEAGWHAKHGWVFVACDHLGAGGSDAPMIGASQVTLETLVAVNAATVEAIWAMLEDGTVAADLPAINSALRLGIGQSVGGSLVIVQQGRHRTFDAVGLVGTDAIALLPAVEPLDRLPPKLWGPDYGDEATVSVRSEMYSWPVRRAPLPDWPATEVLPASFVFLASGAILTEASAIEVPVLLSYSERADDRHPRLESRHFPNSVDVTVWAHPHMGHMRNFATRRGESWCRIEQWADGLTTGSSSA